VDEIFRPGRYVFKEYYKENRFQFKE